MACGPERACLLWAEWYYYILFLIGLAQAVWGGESMILEPDYSFEPTHISFSCRARRESILQAIGIVVSTETCYVTEWRDGDHGQV